MQEETVVRRQHRKTIILETLHIPSLGHLSSLSLSCCQETIMQGLQKSILMHHYLEKDERIHYFSHIQKKKQKQKTTKTTILEDINCNCLIELYLSFLVALLNRNAAQKHTTDLKKTLWNTINSTGHQKILTQRTLKIYACRVPEALLPKALTYLSSTSEKVEVLRRLYQKYRTGNLIYQK